MCARTPPTAAAVLLADATSPANYQATSTIFLLSLLSAVSHVQAALKPPEGRFRQSLNNFHHNHSSVAACPSFMAHCVTRLAVLLLALCCARGVLGLACHIKYSTDSNKPFKQITSVSAFSLPESASGE